MFYSFEDFSLDTAGRELRMTTGTASRFSLLRIHGTGFHCNTVNVSRRPLLIAMSIIDGDGNVLSPAPVPNPKTPPGVNASNDLEPAPDTEVYCKVEVSGTDDLNDVRVVMKVNLIRAFDQGGLTNIPVFLSWILEGR